MASFRALPLPALRGGGGAEEGGSSQGGGASSKGGGSGSGKAGPQSWWDLSHARSRRGGGSPGASAPGAGSPTAVVELCNSEPTGRGSGGLLGLLGGVRRRGQQGRGLASPVCRIEMPRLAPAWAPRIQMFLPSFRCVEKRVLGAKRSSLQFWACGSWGSWQAHPHVPSQLQVRWLGCLFVVVSNRWL